ncbi:MAG: hypothetical protein HYV32_00830 [Candidatus Kerfeldbacteria bacterium]|nr:hypothetical protein [Candidatus Kerfeldbacteria bacterium]
MTVSTLLKRYTANIRWLICIIPIFLIVTLLFYHHTFDQSFFLDDYIFVERSTIGSFADLLNLFSTSQNTIFYRPISTNVYFGTLQLMFGPHPIYFHISNTILLAINGVLLYLILAKFGLKKYISAAAALLYIMNPISFDSQRWISVCQELLSILFFLSSLLFYMYSGYRTLSTKYFLSIFSFILALLSKEMAITLPGVLLLLHLTVERHHSIKEILRKFGPFVIVTILFFLLRSQFLIYPNEGAYSLEFGSFLSEHIRTYIAWAIDGILLVKSNLFIVAVSLFIPIIVAFFANADRRKVMLFGAGWAGGTLLPVLILPFHIYSYYLMLPIIGLYIVFAVCIDYLTSLCKKRIYIPYTLLSFWLLFFAYTTYNQFTVVAKNHGNFTERLDRVTQQVQAFVPHISDNTTFYFVFPADFPTELFIFNGGSILRIAYNNPTVKAIPIDIAHVSTIEKNSLHYIFQLQPNGKLVPLK